MPQIAQTRRGTWYGPNYCGKWRCLVRPNGAWRHMGTCELCCGWFGFELELALACFALSVVVRIHHYYCGCALLRCSCYRPTCGVLEVWGWVPLAARG